MAEQDNQITSLPSTLIGPNDIGRLNRELEKIDETLNQAAIKKAHPDIKVKDISPDLHEVLRQYKIDVLKPEDRKKCLDYFNNLLTNAPVLHFSFAIEPSGAVKTKLVEWLRANIHPMSLVVVGLAPGIGAGCYLRTTNKVFDFTLRTRLIRNKPNLVNRIKQATAAKD